MGDQSVSIPFRTPDLFGGFGEGEGIARATPTEFILEFVLRDSLLNVLRTKAKEIRIPRTELEEVVFKPGWFGAKICVRVKSLSWFGNFPLTDNGELELRIARRHRGVAEDFVRYLKTAAAQNLAPGAQL